MGRRQWLILGSLALVLIALIIALVYVLFTAPSGTSVVLPPPQMTFEAPVAAVTAQSAYVLAREAALQWQEDAYLVSASASWRNATVDLFREPVPWAFQFYSPSTRRLNVFSVSGGEAETLRESYVAYVLLPVTVEAWRADSPQALADWLNASGGRFLRAYTLVDVHATLRYDKELGRAMWFITGLESGGKGFFSHSVKAGL